jgi:hypothetical protein
MVMEDSEQLIQIWESKIQNSYFLDEFEIQMREMRSSDFRISKLWATVEFVRFEDKLWRARVAEVAPS